MPGHVEGGFGENLILLQWRARLRLKSHRGGWASAAQSWRQRYWNMVDHIFDCTPNWYCFFESVIKQTEEGYISSRSNRLRPHHDAKGKLRSGHRVGVRHLGADEEGRLARQDRVQLGRRQEEEDRVLRGDNSMKLPNVILVVLDVLQLLVIPHQCHTLQTVYKIAIWPRGNLPCKLYKRKDLKLL